MMQNPTLSRFKTCFLAVTILASFVLGTTALAQTATSSATTFPTKAVRIVVPFAAGGVADLTVRTVAQKLSEMWGQGVVVDNRPSAGGIVASDAVAKAEPDGHTLLLMSNGSAVSAGLFKTLPYDTIKDFAPLSTLGFFDIGIVVANESKFATLGDLLTFARANPGKLNVGSINIGSTQHLTAELFKTTAGIDVQIVPFNGTPAVVTALRGGQIDVAVEIVAPVMGQIKSKALRLLATTGAKRSVMLTDTPTATELGVKGLNAASWNALAAPVKTPAAIQAKLTKDIATAINTPAVKAKLLELSVDAQASSAENTAALLAAEVRRWGIVIDSAKIPKQ